jgi:competence protein ComEC
MRRTIPLVILLAVLLFARLFFFYNEAHIYRENEKFVESYSFDHEPKKNSYGQYFFVGKLMVSVPLYPVYEYGDKVTISGVVSLKKTDKGGMLVISNPEIKKIESHSPYLAVTKFVRQRIEDTVLTTIPSKEGGLLLGILLGVRDKIESDYYKELKSVGVLHVIAASGQNVSIVAAMLLLVLERTVKRRLALLFTVLGVVFYASIAGFDPPIVRASIMAILAFGALLTGKQSSGIYILFITGVLMVLINPGLITDVSFGLSFLSTLGILTLKPVLDSIASLKFVSLLKDDVTTTLSAQIATFPIMLSAFGSYSWFSFPVNVAILWTVPIIMILGGLGALVSLVFPFLSYPFYLLCYPFLSYFSLVVGFGAKHAIVTNVDTIPASIIVGYYLLFVAVIFKFKKKEHRA